MACADDSQRHEPELLQALNLTTSYRVSGDVLELRADERVLARFQARKK
jgi:heat shock protein HslJ